MLKEKTMKSNKAKLDALMEAYKSMHHKEDLEEISAADLDDALDAAGADHSDEVEASVADDDWTEEEDAALEAEIKDMLRNETPVELIKNLLMKIYLLKK